MTTYPLPPHQTIHAVSSEVRTGFLIMRSFILCLLLTGCQQEDTLNSRYQDYLDRVSNILDIPPVDPPHLEAIAYPDRRSRLLNIPSFEQGLVEVWDFQRCELMSLINQRNSNLGRVMPPSQRFIYENHFWQKLEPCYQKREQWLSENRSFVRRLEETYHHKQRIHPLITHQLFFAGNELESQFSQARPAFKPNDRPDYQSIASALNELADLAETPFRNLANASELEARLQNIHNQPIMHSLLKSLQISTYQLNRISQQIESKLLQRPVCLNGGSTPKAKSLYNVLDKYYLKGIQSVIAHHSRMANQLLPPVNQIVNASISALPESHSDTGLREFQARWLSMDNPDGLWQSFQKANHRHTSVWNRLLRQCGLFPKQQH